MKDKILELPLMQLVHLVSKLKKLSIYSTAPIISAGLYKAKSTTITAILEADSKYSTFTHPRTT